MKVSDMSFADAKAALIAVDAKLQAQAITVAKNPKDAKAIEVLRNCALAYSKAERDARTARDREAKAALGSLL